MWTYARRSLNVILSTDKDRSIIPTNDDISRRKKNWRQCINGFSFSFFQIHYNYATVLGQNANRQYSRSHIFDMACWYCLKLSQGCSLELPSQNNTVNKNNYWRKVVTNAYGWLTAYKQNQNQMYQNFYPWNKAKEALTETSNYSSMN